MDDDFIDCLVKLIEFGFGDLFHVDDYFILVELVFIIFDFLLK